MTTLYNRIKNYALVRPPLSVPTTSKIAEIMATIDADDFAQVASSGGIPLNRLWEIRCEVKSEPYERASIRDLVLMAEKAGAQIEWCQGWEENDEEQTQLG